MVPLKQIKSLFQVSGDKPVIGICYDNRSDPETKEWIYSPVIAEQYRRAIENAGGQILFLTYEDKVEDFKDAIDGYLIPGGRDLHPKYYGQEVNGSVVSGEAQQHYEYNREVYEGLHPGCPVMGVCWGSQFLNVLNGGTLLQHMPDSDEHFKKQRMEIKPGSWLARAVGPVAFGNCYHHQCVATVSPKFEVVAYDNLSKIPHAMELRGSERKVIAILWHPEISFVNESCETFEPSSAALFKAYVEECRKYKASKTNASN